MRKVIFTADDYGAIDEIDQGIRDAVSKRRINSVAVFANGPPSHLRTALVKLIATGDEARQAAQTANQEYSLEIGLHLTLTSGRPAGIAERQECPLYVTDEDGGYRFPDVTNFSFGVDRDTVYRELEAQYYTLAGLLNELQTNRDAGDRYRIRHLSSHHNILTMHEPLFKAYVDLAHRTGTAIRSPIVTPNVRFGMFQTYVYFHTLGENKKKISRKVWEYRDKVRDDFESVRHTVAVPGLIDSTHYGPIPAIRANRTFADLRAGLKRKKLRRTLKQSDPSVCVREFVFHLIKDDERVFDASVAEQWTKEYPGVDPAYFDSRLIETRSLLGLSDRHLRKAKTEVGSWSSLHREIDGDKG